jgi:hypothetical protein
MGTRGFVGFVVDKTEKITYNHCDSYPGGLGRDVLDFLRSKQHELTCDVHRNQSGLTVDLARKLRVVDPESTPTAEDIERLQPFANTVVSGRRLDEWYVLLRETQGNPRAMLEAGVIEDGSQFPADSLFAEYGYMVDLDAMTFEVYEGFQQAPHSKGRFAEMKPHRESNGYFPVALVQSWPLSDLPSDDAFITALEGDDS